MNQTPLTFLITGVLRPSSIATHVAREAVSQGHRVIATCYPGVRPVAQASLKSLMNPGEQAIPLLDLDVTSDDSLTALSTALNDLGVSHLDGLLHAMAFASSPLLDGLLSHPHEREDISTSFDISVASLPRLVGTCRHLLSASGQAHPDRAESHEGSRPSGVVALTFDCAHVWPGYGWMGVMKAALEASVRTMAVECAPDVITVNAVSAGPLPTPASQAIKSLPALLDVAHHAPLGWDAQRVRHVAQSCVTLMSGALPSTTGHVLPCDGGLHLLPPMSDDH